MARNGEWVYESETETSLDISRAKEMRNTKDAWSGVVKGEGSKDKESPTDGNWVYERIQNGRLAGDIHFNILMFTSIAFRVKP